MKRGQSFEKLKEEHSREKNMHMQRPRLGKELEILRTERPSLAGA